MQLRDDARKWLLEKKASAMYINGKLVGFCTTEPDKRGDVYSWGIKEFEDGTIGPDVTGNYSYHSKDVQNAVNAKLGVTMFPVL